MEKNVRYMYQKEKTSARAKKEIVYNFNPAFLLASFSLSLNTRLMIFPLGLLAASSLPAEGDFTTNAFGSSPATRSGTDITQQSATAGCERRCDSISAGAT
ncbi:hypothetical protein I7I48_00969 [Histoplasma ohiense]|nr:hypothetical protein I7I48_00969 [Histoplasma ohiense (nom. inval.)]